MSDESDFGENDKNVGFLFRAMRNRDPRKRKVKPVSKHLLQVNFGGDSEEDSDYEIKKSDLSDDDEDVDVALYSDGATESSNSKGKSPKVTADQDSDAQDEEEDNGADVDGSENDSASCDDDDDDEGSDDDSDDEESEDDDKPKRNYFLDINTDDEDDDEDYVPRKKQKQRGGGAGGGRAKMGEKHIEKQRIRSPQTAQVLEEPAEDSSSAKPMKVLICCVCLGDISETDDEIVECDSCGVAVHEGCYGISDTQSTASTESSASTEPWFCDACKAGVKPDCELCPNEGGIFKETDAGKWVHLVCALYTPGVAFGDVDRLSPVTLFEMPYSKWGLRECSLCEDSRFSRTGVCVSCDAGMCRSFFHVTCAQRNGLLSEASPDEDIADPFYAYCKLHADKITSRAKRRNYLAIQSHVRQHAKLDASNIDEKDRARTRRKLMRHRQKYRIAKAARPPSWVPPQKLVRFLTSSPSVVKKMLRKAELMGIITQSTHTVHTTAEKQERKKSHIGPALTAEYVTYYLDRNVRIDKIKNDLKELEKQNIKLRRQDHALRQQYDKLLKESQDPGSLLRQQGRQLWSILSDFTEKPMPIPDILKPKKLSKSPQRKELPKSPTAVINLCGKCKKSHDQHLLAKCDMCHLWYHLACLDPPLTRMPKKTSRWGWQCSECAKSSSEESEEVTPVNVNAPRRLRDKIKEPAKLSQNKQDMEFLFPEIGRKRDQSQKIARKKMLRKKSPKKKVKVSKKVDKEQMPKAKLESVEDFTMSFDESSMSACENIPSFDESSREAQEPSGVVMLGESVGKAGSSVGASGKMPSAASPEVVHITGTDESSIEVEMKTIEETTPSKQATTSHDVSRTGRKIIKKRHYDDEDGTSDTSPHTQGKKTSPDMPSTSQGKRSASKTPPEKQFGTHCVTCSKPGTKKNMVSCDSCEQCYHFQCLNPPHIRTPKPRGYTWFCEACDVSESSEDEND